MQLGELERLDGIVREAEALTMAERNAMAFNEPQRLERERHRWRAHAGLLTPIAETFAKARELALKVEAQRDN